VRHGGADKQHGLDQFLGAVAGGGDEERAYGHDKIYDELVKDTFTEATRKGHLSVIEQLSSHGAEGVVLACTEIPLLLAPDQIPVPSFSTTELHCQAAVNHAIALD
jgi:aspartate racemase